MRVSARTPVDDDGVARDLARAALWTARRCTFSLSAAAAAWESAVGLRLVALGRRAEPDGRDRLAALSTDGDRCRRPEPPGGSRPGCLFGAAPAFRYRPH